MSELESGIPSDVTPESPASSEPDSSAQVQPAASPQDAAPKPQEVPFHEHPRFKELIEQKNSYQRELQELRQQFAQFQHQQKQQLQPKGPDYDSLFKEMEQVNPVFAQMQREQMAKLTEIEQLKEQLTQVSEWKQSYEQQQAISQFDKLCAENKVGDRDKELYKQWVANAANARGAKISDLPQIFKDVHQQISSYFQDRDREMRESYVKQKKSDATPSTQSGGVPTGLPASKGMESKADVKAAIASALRSAKSI
jgi:hypothetical protein